VVVIAGVKMCLELLPSSILMIKVNVSGMVSCAWFFFFWMIILSRNRLELRCEEKFT
jgi:hypothetical protein